MRISDWSSDVCSSDLDQYKPAARLMVGRGPFRSASPPQQPAQPEAVAAKLLHMTELDEFIVDQRQVRACRQTLIGPAFQPHAFMVKLDLDCISIVPECRCPGAQSSQPHASHARSGGGVDRLPA